MSVTRDKPGRGQDGLTLIEVLISMIILSIITTMLVMGWVNLQRGAAFALSSNNARASARDSVARISNELRAAQPTTLPTPTPSATVTPAAQPPITAATPWDVSFYSAYNSPTAASDGSGVALSAVHLTRIYLDTSTVPSAPWNPQSRNLYLLRDMNGNGTLTDSADLKVLLARNVVNTVIADPTNGTSYTALFRYAYRTSVSSPAQWMDNTSGTLVLGNIVAIRVRVIIDANIAHTPKYIDATTTVRLRNASGS